MTHNIHRTETPVLHDGCAECEERGANPAVAIAHMDSSSFVKAWARATRLQTEGLDDGQQAELATLRALAAVQVQFERRGLPLGALPV